MPRSLILHALCLVLLLRSTSAMRKVVESRTEVLKRIDGDVSENRLYFERCRQSSEQENCLFAIDDSINQEPWSNECATTGADERPWWQGKLEAPSYITRVSLFNLIGINDRGLDALMHFEIKAGSHMCSRYRAYSSFLNKTFACDTFSDYLRIESNNAHSVLALCEVKIYGKAVKFMRNLEKYANGEIPIFGRSCIGSSIQESSSCHLMADGNLDQRANYKYCASTEPEVTPFFEVRLHEAALIRYAIVWNQVGNDGKILSNFEISVDGQICAKYDNQGKVFLTKYLLCNRFGSAVRLTSYYKHSKETHQLTLCELQLFGDLIDFATPITSKYLGCYKEKKQRRDVETLVAINRMSPEKCARICRRNKKPFFGLQMGKQCWCTERYGLYGMADEDACWMPCDNSGEDTCGAKLYNSIYEVKGLPGDEMREED